MTEQHPAPAAAPFDLLRTLLRQAAEADAEYEREQRAREQREQEAERQRLAKQRACTVTARRPWRFRGRRWLP